MLLINALIKVPKLADRRLFVHTQLKLSGMETHLLPTLYALDHHQLNYQAIVYENATTLGQYMNGKASGDNSSLHSYYSCIKHPVELVDQIVKHATTSSPRSKGHILSILKNLLLIQDNPATTYVKKGGGHLVETSRMTDLTSFYKHLGLITITCCMF
jgi:hypothetical protein